ncbi:MAG TPA: ABC transporter substrate-binding protein [Ilumatobacter sp.]|nr:ABC transporter substrate-binding protein [Ilumatobacter sp.]
MALGIVAALVAAACGGSDDDDDTSDATTDAGTETTVADDPTTTVASSQPTGGDDDTTTTDADAPATTAAPVDVASRFTGNDAFCVAGAAPAEAPADVDAGITSTAIQVAHVRNKLEDLVSIGFASDLGDQNDFAQTFVDVINDECGGIHGRQLELVNVEVPVLGFAPDADAVYQEACITIAEEQHAVVAWSNSGVGNPLGACLTGQNETIFLATYDFGASDFERSNGRLFTVTHAPADILTYAVRELADELAGKTIGVVFDDGDPNPEIIEQGLLDAMDAVGLEPARVDVIPCPNGPPCNEGLIASVQGMRDAGVDAMFVLLDGISMSGYMAELVTQGAEPGSIQFYGTSFLAQDSELLAGKLIEFGGQGAGELYDGAVIIGSNQEGDYRAADYQPDAFFEMCNATYADHSSAAGAPFDPSASDDEARFASNVSGHCAFVRMLARSIEAAGPNPTRDDIAAAVAALGDVQLGSGTPASFTPGKPTAPDAIVRNVFEYPCSVPVENSVGHCVRFDSDFLPIPEG